jgi:Domain of unknown function (DUF4276)
MKSKIKPFNIAILGEHPDNDAEAFRTLLEKRPYPKIQFSVPIRNLRGDDLKVTPVVIRYINDVMKEKNIDKFILVHDLDGLLSETVKVRKMDEWFEKINKGIDKKGIFYLVVAETETLLLSDIDIINKRYGTKLKKYGNPMMISDPKKELKDETSKINEKTKYHQNHCTDLMEKISFQEVYKNHKGERSFQAFIDDLDEIFK